VSTNKRNVNVELFRVFATVMVVILHVMGCGGVLHNVPGSGVNYWTAWFIECFAYGAVNCFALITGFVMVDKSVKLKNIIRLWMQVFFYSVLLTVLAFIFFPESRTVENAVVSLLPIIGDQWWYTSSYFGLFLLMPFLNAGIERISRQTHKKILLAVLVGVGFIGSILRIYSIDAFMLDRGYSVLWLAIVYLFGAYIKKYEVHKRFSALKGLIGFVGMVALTFLSRFGTYYVTDMFFGGPKHENLFITYTSITVLLSSVFLFIMCLNLKIGKISEKVICFFAPMSLGVYLIHVHTFVYNYMIYNSFIPFGEKHVALMVLYVLAATVTIYLTCALVDWLRIQLFKLIRIDRFSEFLAKKINSLYSRVFDKKC